MDERKLQFRVGAMVLMALLITGILVALFGNMPLSLSPKTTIYVRFAEAPGAAPDTPVRKSGILIGRVSDIRFDKDDTGVVVTVRIDPHRTVYHDEKCRIVNSLIGIGSDTVLEFVRRPGEGPHTPIKNGETIQGEVAADPTRAIVDLEQSLGNTMSRVNSASDALGSTFHRIDTLLSTNEDRINRVIREAGETLDALKSTLNNTNDIIGDAETRKGLKDAIQKFPKTLDAATKTAQQMGDAMETVQHNLKNLQGLTEPLGRRGEMLVQRMTDGTGKLNEVMDEMLRFSRTLNDPSSAIGQLMNNPELVRHLTRAIKNIDEITRQLKPILDDARVFSDKIARHPEVLGVRGAIKPSPGIK